MPRYAYTGSDFLLIESWKVILMYASVALWVLASLFCLLLTLLIAIGNILYWNVFMFWAVP